MKIGRSISPRAARFAKLGNKIDRTTLGIAPGRALPAGTDEHVGPGVKDDGHAIGLKIGAIADADFALDHRDAVERLARLLIGQLEMAKAFVRKIESTVDAPQLALLPGRRSCLRDRGRIDDPDQATPARLGRGRRQHVAHQHGQPIPALTQAIEQRHIRNIYKADRGRPCRCGSQASLPRRYARIMRSRSTALLISRGRKKASSRAR